MKVKVKVKPNITTLLESVDVENDLGLSEIEWTNMASKEKEDALLDYFNSDCELKWTIVSIK